ncbi:MAG TPA: DUF411 domain-containing protein [Burkholderiales bacterium]|nr:DUF411 domain-containing protein [Burkholderiales bacterium]
MRGAGTLPKVPAADAVLGPGLYNAFMRRILLLLLFLSIGAAHAADTIEVWKDPSCGCCKAWIDHLKASGFAVRAHDVSDIDAARAKNGVPRQLGSCHTARVAGYALEGHVPASDIRRLLKERPPQAAGLAVPGMPAGSPGMEMGEAKDPYDVILFRKDGGTSAWNSYNQRR